jgi:antitoxin (DNA-binding transcriptional repressor) of toxin-antitoxin stability system
MWASGKVRVAPLVTVLRLCYMRRMKQLNLREANQAFSRLVREIEQTGERVVVLRNGKPAVEIVRSNERRALRRRTPEQERAIRAFLKLARARPGDSSGEPRWTRGELHER